MLATCKEKIKSLLFGTALTEKTFPWDLLNGNLLQEKKETQRRTCAEATSKLHSGYWQERGK
jgi:hypothetical protein